MRELADKKIEIPIAGITHHTRAHSDSALARRIHMPLGLSWGTAYTHPAYEPNRLLACIAVPPSLSPPPSLTSPIPSSPLAMATDGGREYPPRPLRSRPRLHSFLPTPLARGPASSLSVPDSASVSVCSIDSVHRATRVSNKCRTARERAPGPGSLAVSSIQAFPAVRGCLVVASCVRCLLEMWACTYYVGVSATKRTAATTYACEYLPGRPAATTTTSARTHGTCSPGIGRSKAPSVLHARRVDRPAYVCMRLDRGGGVERSGGGGDWRSTTACLHAAAELHMGLGLVGMVQKPQQASRSDRNISTPGSLNARGQQEEPLPTGSRAPVPRSWPT